MDWVEAIMLCIVSMAGLGWFVGKICGLNTNYEKRLKDK